MNDLKSCQVALAIVLKASSELIFLHTQIRYSDNTMSSQRLGPKQLSIDKKPRAFSSKPLKSKARRSFNTRRKLQVLSFWATPSIPYEWDPNELWCPTIREVSEHFGGIPLGSISGWRDMEKELLECAAGDWKRITKGIVKWPELESNYPISSPETHV